MAPPQWSRYLPNHRLRNAAYRIEETLDWAPDWLSALVIFGAALTVGLVVHRVLAGTGRHRKNVE